MPENTDSKPGPGQGRRNSAQPLTAWEELEMQRRKELEANLAALQSQWKHERRQRRLRHMASLWPLIAGLLLGAMAPLLRSIVQAVCGQTGVVVLFPYVVLAARPELQAGPITHMLPSLMLYAQFPVEGWLARFILRRRVHLANVVGQVLLFHGLGLAELWLLSGGLEQLLRW